MCQCVNHDQEKRFPWCLIFHCRTSIDGAKNNLWDVQSVPTSDKSQSRPQASGCDRMFINSASVTSVGATQIIGNDWEIMKASAGLSLPSWPLTSRSPGDFDSSGADAAVGWRLELSFFCSPGFFFLPTETVCLCSCLSSGVWFTYLWHRVCIRHCDHTAWVTWHTDWTICQSGGKPFVILCLYRAQFTSPSPTFKWIRGEKEAHNAMFTDAACPQDSGTLTIFEKNTDESLSAS